MKQTGKGIAVLLAILVLAPAVVPARQDRALFISPEYAAMQIKKQAPEMLLVDVRSRTAFEKVHADGSIHIPVHFIKIKNHLKSKTLVLVNNGFCRQELIRACRGLNEKGFAARILDGGLNAWTLKGLPVKGGPAAGKALFRVTPREAFQEHTARTFLPVDISGGQAEPVFSGTLALNKQKAGRFTALKRYNKSSPNGALLVFSRDGAGYEPIRKQLQSAGVKNVFFLSGGLTAYKVFLSDRERARAPRSQRLKTVNKPPCTNCGE